MKLDVIIGYREYLDPTPVPREEVLGFLAAHGHTVDLPLIGWSPRIDDTCYASFTTEATGDVGERVALLVEYLQDITMHGDRVAVIVPFESYLEHGACVAGARRVRRFMDAAIDVLGTHRVRCVALGLSHNTQDVLQQLHEASGRRRDASNVTPADFEIIELVGERALHGAAESTTMRRNYTEAVLQICAQIVSKTLLFDGSRRVATLVDHLAQNQLFMRPELEADEVLEQLEPGGDLYELLAKPLLGMRDAP